MTLKTTQKETTKRGMLSQLASIYDPLGLASPTSLIGEQLYRDICDNITPWDTQLPESLFKRWRDWNSTLREDLVVPRALTPYHQPTSQLTLHAFGDASVNGACVAVYAVVHLGEIVTQQLVCAKSRLAKKNLTIPRLELIARHMSVNLVTNVQAALTIHPSTIHCWLDSTIALYWIKGQGEYNSLSQTEWTRFNNTSKLHGITFQLRKTQLILTAEGEMLKTMFCGNKPNLAVRPIKLGA